MHGGLGFLEKYSSRQEITFCVVHYASFQEQTAVRSGEKWQQALKHVLEITLHDSRPMKWSGKLQHCKYIIPGG